MIIIQQRKYIKILIYFNYYRIIKFDYEWYIFDDSKIDNYNSKNFYVRNKDKNIFNLFYEKQ